MFWNFDHVRGILGPPGVGDRDARTIGVPVDVVEQERRDVLAADGAVTGGLQRIREQPVVRCRIELRALR